MNIIEVSKVSKRFDGHQALDSVSLSIPKGTIYGLLGPNGAGKTTLIRLLTQIFHADTGKIFFKGFELNSGHISLVGYLPEERGLYRKMKVDEQLLFFGRLQNLPKKIAKERINFWLDKLNLHDWKSEVLESLSKGMQQKVQFIAAVLHDPEMIILDEPFSGFDPVNAALITEEILHLKKAGKTIVFSTHRMDTVEALCDNIALIDEGKCVLEGKLQAVKQQFKRNHFLVKGNGILSDSASALKIINKVQGENTESSYTLQLLPGYTSNDMLGQLISYLQITEFRELLPGMQEIFMSQVQKKQTAISDA